ncbi:MAG: DNA polymerase III subunit gamma/tau [Bacteroidota bacterium]
MSFVVSARKYRPIRFDEVVGQEHISQTLKNALQSDQVAHAFLFCGPRGVGKTTCARILAKVLNCETPTQDMEACNECNSCKAFNDNASFNIHELDAASNNSVEHIRTLTDQVRFPPQQGKYKVYIIDEVHMLSQAAFNAFLKTLEEPPPYAIFILATTEKHKIIPTILSRCQIYDFKRIRIPDIVKHLESICQQEGIDAEQDALHIVAQKADGALRDALSIFDRIASFSNKKIEYKEVIKNLNILDYDYYFKVVDALLVEDLSGILVLFDEIINKGFEPDIFINGLAGHLRNLLVCKDQATAHLLEVGETIRQKYADQSALSPTSLLLTALSLANDCDVNFRMARNKRLHVEMTIIKMAYINRVVKFNPVANNAQPQPVQAEKKSPELKEPPKTEEVAKKVVEPIAEVQPKKEPLNTEPPKEEGQPILSSQNGGGSLKSDLLGKSSLINPALMVGSHQSHEAEVEAAEEETVLVEKTDITLDDVMQAWTAFAETIKSPSAKNYFQSAELVLENGNIHVMVGSKVAEGSVRSEMGLVPFLEEQLKTKALTLTFEIDKSRMVEEPEVKKPLSEKEKYQRLREKNPLIDDLQKRFDLRLDRP